MIFCLGGSRFDHLTFFISNFGIFHILLALRSDGLTVACRDTKKATDQAGTSSRDGKAHPIGAAEARASEGLATGERCTFVRQSRLKGLQQNSLAPLPLTITNGMLHGRQDLGGGNTRFCRGALCGTVVLLLNFATTPGASSSAPPQHCSVSAVMFCGCTPQSSGGDVRMPFPSSGAAVSVV